MIDFLSIDLVFRNGAGAISSSMTENLVSNGIDLRNRVGCGIQFKYTGAPEGTMTVESTCDDILSGTQNWVTVAGSTVAVTGIGDWVYNISDNRTGFVRLVYTFTSGTGTLTGKVIIKGV